MPSIVGTWKMVGATALDRDGKPLPAPYGGKGMGRVAFTAEGRMMAVTCDGRPELPPGAARAYSSYCVSITHYKNQYLRAKLSDRRTFQRRSAKRPARSPLPALVSSGGQQRIVAVIHPPLRDLA
jgi:hypothetical protein